MEMKKILGLILCHVLKHHKWTANVEKGIKPTEGQLKTVSGFWDYAKMYCDRCGHVYHRSNELICKYKSLESK
jgi:hypothetical protein